MISDSAAFFNDHRLPLGCCLAVATFFAFFNLGSTPLMEWDESLHGELAMQMLENGEYLSYYFGGVHETWFAKPPLAIWAIAGSYAIFGTNEFALRLPSALAIIASFYFIFQICRIHRNVAFAFWTTLMLITVNGLIGPHVGRTGDTDAMLVLFLLAASWSFLRYVDQSHLWSGLFIGVFLGLAFWTKGPAALVLIPAWVIYLLLTRRFIKVLKSPMTYGALTILSAFISIWVLAVTFLSTQFTTAAYLGDSTLEVMINYDLLHRFAGHGDSGGSDPFTFFFTCTDSKLSLWIHVGYLLMFFTLLRKKFTDVFSRDQTGHFALFCFLSWSILSVFLSFTSSNHDWYLAPALPFLAMNIWMLISHYARRYKLLSYGVYALFILTLAIKVENFGNPKPQDQFMVQLSPTIIEADDIIFQSSIPFDRFLFCHFENPNCRQQHDLFEEKTVSNTLYVIRSEDQANYKAQTSHLHIVAQDQENIVFTMAAP